MPLWSTTTISRTRTKVHSCGWNSAPVPTAADSCANGSPPKAEQPSEDLSWLSRFTAGTIHLRGIECFRNAPAYLKAVEGVVRDMDSSLVLEGSLEGARLLVLPVVGGKHNGEDVALELVRQGLALAAGNAPETFRDAERSARLARRGEWAAVLGAPVSGKNPSAGVSQ